MGALLLFPASLLAMAPPPELALLLAAQLLQFHHRIRPQPMNLTTSVSPLCVCVLRLPPQWHLIHPSCLRGIRCPMSVPLSPMLNPWEVVPDRSNFCAPLSPPCGKFLETLLAALIRLKLCFPHHPLHVCPNHQLLVVRHCLLAHLHQLLSK